MQPPTTIIKEICSAKIVIKMDTIPRNAEITPIGEPRPTKINVQYAPTATKKGTPETSVSPYTERHSRTKIIISRSNLWTTLEMQHTSQQISSKPQQ